MNDPEDDPENAWIGILSGLIEATEDAAPHPPHPPQPPVPPVPPGSPPPISSLPSEVAESPLIGNLGSNDGDLLDFLGLGPDDDGDQPKQVEDPNELPVALAAHYLDPAFGTMNQTLLAAGAPTLDQTDYRNIYGVGNVPGGHPYCFSPKVLGRGAFGLVVQGSSWQDPNCQVAIKVSKVADNTSGVSHAVNEYKVFARINANTRHDNLIVTFVAFGGPEYSILPILRYYTIMQFSPIGDLKGAVEMVDANGQKVWMALQDRYCRHLIRGIAQGVRHLFSIGIAHGDLKMENVLVFWFDETAVPPTFGNDGLDRFLSMVPKLTDFTNSGLSADNDNAGPINAIGPRCTIYTAAPETWFTDSSYDMKAADVYSVANLLLSFLFGCHPYAHTGNHPIYRPPFPAGFGEGTIIQYKKSQQLFDELIRFFSEPLQDLLRRAMRLEPTERLSIDEFIGHPWMNEP